MGIYRIIIIGKQGTGKGTQAQLLAKKLNLKHISTGDIFREAMKEETPLGVKAREYIDAGNLVPDEITDLIVEEYFNNHPEDIDNFILDGYPRNIAQADFLYRYLQDDRALTNVLILDAPDDVIVKRMSSRFVCEECGKVYSIDHSSVDSNSGDTSSGDEVQKCANCNGKLYQREDDKPEAIKKRLALYDEKTKPLIEYYEKRETINKIDANKTIDEVFANISKIFD